jgi:galactose mutarotase-like enzyme
MITLNLHNSSLTVDLQGGYVDSWMLSGLPILYRGSDLKRRGIPILFPYFGKPSPELPQHGFGRDTLWRCLDKNETSMSMCITDADISDAAKGYYPYRFEATIELALIESNTLQYALNVKNTGYTPLPISPGLHPYWSVAHEAKKRLVIDSLPDFNTSTIDWDNTPPDNDYTFRNPTVFHTNKYSLTMLDNSPGGGKVKQVTIWSQPLDKADHDFVCIEPICGIRGGYMSDPVQISQDEQWEMTVLFEAQIK